MSAAARPGPAGARDARYPWWLGPGSWLGALMLRALGGTWRIERSGLEDHAPARAAGQAVIYALWHSRLLSLVYVHRGEGVAVLVSRHRDGELITRIIGRLGYVTGRGSSTRGGEEGLREMIEWGRRGRTLAITPDGPRGPAERVKPGLLALASHTGLPIVPVASATRSFWKLRSWDGFRIPRPFARLRVTYGPPIPVPAGLEREALATLRDRVEAAVAATTAEAERLAGAPR